MKRTTATIVIAASPIAVLAQVEGPVTLGFSDSKKLKHQIFISSNLKTEAAVDPEGMQASGLVSTSSVCRLQVMRATPLERHEIEMSIGRSLEPWA